MKFCSAAFFMTLLASSTMAQDNSKMLRGLKKGGKKSKASPMGRDNSERLLFREGVIDAIPPSLCAGTGPKKNVILVVGDGMGWEMIRAGAIAKKVITELEGLGVDIQNGATGATADAAKAAFAGRSLDDYYTEGKGEGLSFQELSEYAIMTTTTVLTQKENPGQHYAPAQSLLEGKVSDHYDGMAPLATDEKGEPLEFDPRDYESEGGMMILWDDVKGGKYPWDEDYFVRHPEEMSKGFDPWFKARHATDSASTAGSMATGHKAAVNMSAVNLYEEKMSTIIEDAMACGMAGGVVSSVPILHATPAAFVSHSNYRKNGPQMQETFKKTNPSLAIGVCTSRYQPSEDHKYAMEFGTLKDQWTFLYQNPDVLAEDFYTPIKDLDPDDDQHVMGCIGGQYSSGRQSNHPYRGVDSSYSNRYCLSAEAEMEDGEMVGWTPTSTICDHYPQEELKNIPKIYETVKEAVEFLGKDDDGFFLMYEQGDIDWAAHANHMDDMLGTMFDIDDSIREIMTWIENNGGWDKNALYVTADHDHYLTLEDQYPEVLAGLIIDGKSYDITPPNTSGRNPLSTVTALGLHEDPKKFLGDSIKDFTTWDEADIDAVGHFWGVRNYGGNAWGSHSTKPVPVSYQGDSDCIKKLEGKGYQVLGYEVEGSPDKIDQVHLHACMMKTLFGL